jgi:hypothetical protein
MKRNKVKEPMSEKNDCLAKNRNDSRSTHKLLEDATAAVGYKDSDDDVLSELYWGPVRILHARADDSVMAAANTLLASPLAVDRCLAGDVLAQVAYGDETRRAEAASLLLPVFENETDSEVLKSMSFAFGHIGDDRSVARLVDLSGHPDEDVRYAVVFGLSGRDDARAIEALISLSSDVDPGVRDWATFGLGSLTDTDTPAIRNALFARLEDDDDEIRGEALVGLAIRGEADVVPALLKELGKLPPDVLRDWLLIQDAAEAIIKHAEATGSMEWRPALERLQALEIGDPKELQRAIKRCTSSAK